MERVSFVFSKCISTSVCTEDVEMLKLVIIAVGLFGGKMLSDHLLLAVDHHGQVSSFLLCSCTEMLTLQCCIVD